MKSVSRGSAGGVEGDGDGAGQLHVTLQRVGGVDQHVVAGLDFALVGDALGDDEGAAAAGGYRVGRVVGVDVVGFFAGRGGGQRAVAVQRIGVAAGVDVPLDVVGAGQGPVLLGAPAVLAHDEDADRRLVHQAGLDVLEPVVEPAQQVLVQLDAGSGPKSMSPVSPEVGAV